MTSAGRNERSLGRAGVSLAAVGALLLVLLLAAPAVRAAPTSARGPTYTPTSWTDGAIVCSFDPSGPGVTVSAESAPAIGLWLGMGSVTESLAGVVLASASLNGSTWVATNESNTTLYSVSYQTSVSVLNTDLIPLPAATIRVGFSLADSPAAGASSDRVAVSLSIVSWPWVSDLSQLAVTIALAQKGGAHLAANGTTSVASYANATGALVAYLATGGQANATSSGGTVLPVVVAASIVHLSASAAGMSFLFGSPADGASSVNYSAEVIVPLPGRGSVAIPTSYLAAAAGAAVVASLAIAGVTRRVRRAPSDLEYVEEEA